MSLKFKGTIKEFKGYVKAMQQVFGKEVKVKEIILNIK